MPENPAGEDPASHWQKHQCKTWEMFAKSFVTKIYHD
jgi:hypothetical protein